MTTQQDAREFLTTIDTLTAKDKAWLRNVAAAMIAERMGKATAEQAALLAQARRELAEAEKGEAQ